MILKSLKLHNIRSYKDLEIEFPLGTTLFEGEVGSGKSTILLAIEFALFGLGSQKGASLLRIGEKTGSVTLRFEVNGKEYEIHRTLERRRKSVGQSSGYLRTEEGRLDLSVSELKERILDILHFREPEDPRAQSVIYRYAIYTPQEEMKNILVAKAEHRLQTLRKAFGIEDYKIASENAMILRNKIREKTVSIEGEIKDLDEKKKERDERKKAIEKDKEKLQKSKETEKDLKDKLEAYEKELDDLRAEREEIKKIEAQIPHFRRIIKENNERITRLETESKKLTKECDEISLKIENLGKTKKPTEKTVQELQDELKQLRKKHNEMLSAKSKIDGKIEEYISIQQNGICPTCDREVDPKEFEEKIKAKNKEKEEAEKKLKECQKEIERVDDLIEKLADYNNNKKELERLEKRFREIEKRMEEISNETKTLSNGIRQANKNLTDANNKIKQLEKVSLRIKELEGLIRKTRDNLKDVRDNISSLNTEINLFEGIVQKLEEEIKRKEEQKKLRDRLDEYRIWLDDYFIPTLGNIEKHVMININNDFNEQFQRWFNMLLEDPTKEVRIDEDFTPIVEQDGYEQDIAYLSGGERSSIALAYRLALNSIVQKVSTGMKSNVLILDEPTDGFSKEQIFKMRDILDQLNCPQVIIVSHESELESFTDKIFQVKKSGGRPLTDNLIIMHRFSHLPLVLPAMTVV